MPSWPADARDALVAAGIELDDEQVRKLRSFCELIEARGAVMNLVSAADRDRLFDRHLFDSLTVLPAIEWSGRTWCACCRR